MLQSAPIVKKLEVRDIMTEGVKSLSKRDSALTAYDMMDEGHFRHIPIVDGDEVVGLLSERDLLRHALSNTAELPLSAQRDYLENIQIEELMTIIPQTVEPETHASEAGSIMLEYKISCLPVVENQRLVGIVTESDFVRYLADK